MKKLQKILITAFLLGGIFLYGTASALTLIPGPIPGPLDIDFRTAAWSGADGSPVFSPPGINVEATADPEGRVLYQDGDDGLGIRVGAEVDEVELDEILTVDLDTDPGQGLWITGVWITDLYDAPDGGLPGERGMMSLYFVGGGVLDVQFDGNTSDQGNGEIFVDFETNYLVDYVKFMADNNARFFGQNPFDNEFSVAGFTQPVPEPATMLLLGSGLLGLAGYGRRKFRK